MDNENIAKELMLMASELTAAKDVKSVIKDIKDMQGAVLELVRSCKKFSDKETYSVFNYNRIDLGKMEIEDDDRGELLNRLQKMTFNFENYKMAVENALYRLKNMENKAREYFEDSKTKN